MLSMLTNEIPRAVSTAKADLKQHLDDLTLAEKQRRQVE